MWLGKTNSGHCHDWTAEGCTETTPSLVSSLPLKLFLWKERWGVLRVLLINQHLRIVEVEGVLLQVPVRKLFVLFTTELEFQVTGACGWSVLHY